MALRTEAAKRGCVGTSCLASGFRRTLTFVCVEFGCEPVCASELICSLLTAQAVVASLRRRVKQEREREIWQPDLLGKIGEHIFWLLGRYATAAKVKCP